MLINKIPTYYTRNQYLNKSEDMMNSLIDSLLDPVLIICLIITIALITVIFIKSNSSPLGFDIESAFEKMFYIIPLTLIALMMIVTPIVLMMSLNSSTQDVKTETKDDIIKETVTLDYIDHEGYAYVKHDDDNMFKVYTKTLSHDDKKLINTLNQENHDDDKKFQLDYIEKNDYIIDDIKPIEMDGE